MASALVWFKRDLRLVDHAPLAAAAAFDAAAALYVVEPDWLASPEFDAQHLDFALANLAPLRAALAARGLPLQVSVGRLPQVLDALHVRWRFTHLLSHEETGPGWSWQRDKAVAAWCRANGIVWQEFAQTGVVRRLPTRSGWAARWAARMDAPVSPTPEGWRGAPLEVSDLPTLRSLGVAPHGRPLPPAGEAAAIAVLAGFLAGRGRDYRRALSSPLTAERGCSRLSAHLAFGTVSMRRVHQATEAAIAGTDDRALAHSLRGFAGRLRWHCHFMQKLEDEPAIESRNFARVTDGLRPGDVAGGAPPFGEPEQRRFEAWCAGRTGYPMVDACMRFLRATGWLNFRMRALLVSFASYHLWLHWRDTGVFLARQFLDFEPGIHWSQMQMQSGTTGINTLRIYSPTKQALDHDPEGLFIRRWVPELARVPLPRLAEPWRMTDEEQRAAGCVIGTAYPAPVVDDRGAVRQAKERLYALRATPAARAEADAVQQRHGSRKSGLPPSGVKRRRRPPQGDDRQPDLFGAEAAD